MGGVTGMQWVEAMGAAKHPTMHRTVPLDQDLPSFIVSSAEVKKPLQQSRGKKQQNREKKFNKDQKHFKTTLLMQPYVFSDSR